MAKEKVDVPDCRELGFIELGLNFFPVIKFRDTKGSRKLWWNCSHFYHIHRSAVEPLAIYRVAAFTLAVISKLELGGFAYSKGLEKYREHGWPRSCTAS